VVELNPDFFSVPGHGDVEIGGWDYGGDGPPLILCHCTGGVARTWDPVVEALGERFRCIALDARGHGDSGKPKEREDYVWENAAWDLLKALEALELGDGVQAAGHSFGGAQVARAAQLAPERFGRVVLVDAILAPGEVPGARELARRAKRRRTCFPSREEAGERFAAKPPMQTWHPSALEAYLRHGLEMSEDGLYCLKCRPEVEAWCYELSGMPHAFEALPELTCEVLLVTGDGSPVAPLVEQQAERLPSARKISIPDAGHFIPQEAPGALADWLAA